MPQVYRLYSNPVEAWRIDMYHAGLPVSPSSTGEYVEVQHNDTPEETSKILSIAKRFGLVELLSVRIMEV